MEGSRRHEKGKFVGVSLNGGEKDASYNISHKGN
jgi:hypothetical protein